MKIAVFGTMWNEEVMTYYYAGFNKWAQQTGNIVDMFVCYGRTNLANPYNVGEYAMYDYADFERYDGVIMIASNINEESVRKRLEQRIREAEIPCVVVDYAIEGFSRIYIDQEMYVKQIVEHLVKKHGVKKLAYIGGLPSNVEASNRRAGFCKGVQENGLELREDWIYEMRFRLNDGYDVTTKLLEQEDDFPEAFVCANDDMAAGVCEALQDAGKVLGEDCRVTGFDQYFLGENYAPSLTTVRRPRESIAYHACEMLASYQGPTEYEEQANLIFGETCGCGNKYCRNENTFRRLVFNTYNNRDMFSAMTAHMEESMISGDGFESAIDDMKKIFDRFHDGKCRVMLQTSLFIEGNVQYGSYRTCTKEYMLWQKEEANQIEGHAYVYAPIHFLDHLYGYCVFRDIPQFMMNKELYNFTKSIGFSMENMVQKRKYAIVNDKLQDLYETDYLTGTYNRHGYAKYAEQMLREARSTGKKFEVIFIDVDGLKKINDQFGHEEGDVVIRIVGQAVSQKLDQHAKAFRYGGDEFLVLHTGTGEVQQFYDMVEREIKEKSEEMNLPYQVSASMGHVIAMPEETKSLEEYVKEADQLMYEIKRERHKNRGAK